MKPCLHSPLNKSPLLVFLGLATAAHLSFAAPVLTNGPMETIVCIGGAGDINVRMDDLEGINFIAHHGDRVLRYDDFQERYKQIGDTNVEYARYKFPNRPKGEPNFGWLSTKYVKLKSQCDIPLPKAGEVDLDFEMPNATFMFPLRNHATENYLTGKRRFGASRGSRTHAACDLYFPKGKDVISVSKGKVIRGVHYFYQSTYDLQVKLDTGQVIRYGEILGREAPGIAYGMPVKKGQVVGFVGKTDCCEPMLHFEMYSGLGSGSLSVKGSKPYGRRWDLLNPTENLRSAEKATFGSTK